MRMQTMRRHLASWARSSESVWVRGLDADEVARSLTSARVFGGRASFVPPSALGYELPRNDVPEIAFAGKSNVGKSTLVGALLRDGKILRTSKTPGCTTAVNFFAVGSAAAARGARRPGGGKKRRLKADEAAAAAAGATLFVVDLPGFGFAKRGLERKDAFQRATVDYLSSRPRHVLRHAFALFDARRGPDPAVLEAFSALRVPHRVVLTKADAAKPADVVAALEALEPYFDARLSSLMPIVHVVSAKTGVGVADLERHVATLVHDPA